MKFRKIDGKLELGLKKAKKFKVIINYIVALCWGGAKCSAIKARGSLGQDKIAQNRKDKSLIH